MSGEQALPHQSSKRVKGGKLGAESTSTRKPPYNIEKRMNRILARLGLPFTVEWTPDPTRKDHGNIAQGIIHIFDESEAEAWTTFLHEIIEIRLNKITNLYMTLVNSLIDLIEKQVYKEKETFIESLPKIMEEIEKERAK